MPDAASTSAITVASKSGLLSLTHRYGSTRWIFSAAEESDSEFEKAASKLDPLLRRALVEDIVDEDDTALVEKLGCEKLTQTRSVLRRKAALSPVRRCAAVDSDRDVTRDSVDHMAQHQLNIKVERLIELIGRPDVDGLGASPTNCSRCNGTRRLSARTRQARRCKRGGHGDGGGRERLLR